MIIFNLVCFDLDVKLMYFVLPTQEAGVHQGQSDQLQEADGGAGLQGEAGESGPVRVWRGWIQWTRIRGSKRLQGKP